MVDISKVGKNVDFQEQGDTLLSDWTPKPHFYRVILAISPRHLGIPESFGGLEADMRAFDTRFTSWANTPQELFEDLAKWRATMIFTEVEAGSMDPNEELVLTADSLTYFMGDLPVLVHDLTIITDFLTVASLENAKRIIEDHPRVAEHFSSEKRHQAGGLISDIVRLGRGLLKAFGDYDEILLQLGGKLQEYDALVKTLPPKAF